MAIRFVFDEHFRNIFLKAVRRHNAAGGRPLAATEVGEPADLPRGLPDPDVLIWAEANGHILVTFDEDTMIGHLADHLAAGRHSPGIMIVRRGFSLGAIIDYLVLATYAGVPADFADRVTFVP